MRNVLAIAACVVLVSVAMFAGAKPRDAFDGKWSVTLTPESGGRDQKDTLTFAGDKITSEFLKKDGFKEAAYEADTRGGQIGTFTATQEGKKGAKAKWTGTAAPGSLEGTLTVTTEGGETKTYNYKGTKLEK